MDTMDIDYVVNQAHYKVFNGCEYVAAIIGLTGVWATGKTIEECKRQLEQKLTEWLQSRENNDLECIIPQ